ncbi:MAG: hypothetical protein IH885_08120, partial [Myxococcales bacterium]|nr:hypothetical protein [Myxococcales bacterium]
VPFGAAAQAVDAGDDVVLECQSEDGAEYTLNGTAPSGEGIVNEWTTDPEVDLANADTLTPTGEFPLGVTTATLTSTTEGSDSESDSATVTVEDTEAPVVWVEADPWYLWPPDHSMQEIEVRVRIKDHCSGKDDFDVELIEAKSSEPDNSTGDGNTTNDIQGADIGSDDRNVRLRAERKGNGNGRIYTLTYRITDGNGNETDAEAIVHVPHDASDLKDLIRDHDGDRGEIGPICPRPTKAIDELAEIFPGLGSARNAKTCKTICKVWTKSCNLIGSGSAKCVQGEIKARALVKVAKCKDSDDRGEIKECRSEAKTMYKRWKALLKEDAAEAKATCARHGERCLNVCDDMFGGEI